MKRIPRSHARRLSFLLLAVLLIVGVALGALPAAAASTAAPYTAEFYADGVLVASVPFDPEVGISAEIAVPKKDGYTGAWEPYTLAERNILIQAVYTPIEGYQRPIDDLAVIHCLVVLIIILLVAILLLVILTLRARSILRANGLWGKGKKEKEKDPAPEKDEQKKEAKEKSTSAKEKSTSADRKAADKTAAEDAAAKDRAKGKKASSETEEATATGKKSNASVEDKAEKKEADSDHKPAEASKKHATASAPASASTASDEGKTEKDEEKKKNADQKKRSFIPVPLVVDNSDEDKEEKDEAAEKPEPSENETADGKKDKTASDKEDKDRSFIPVPLVVDNSDEDKEEKDEAAEKSEQKAAPKEKASASAAETADGREEISTVLVGKDGRRVQVKYRQSFRARIIGACEESKGYYNELKNYLLSFEDVNGSDSQNYESFSSGRSQLAKLNITGKTVLLFLALDPDKLEGSKYKYENVGNRKRYEKTPVKLKVRSARSVKWAKELINMAMAENGRPFVALRNEKHVPDEAMSREEMIRAGLVRVDARDMETGEKVDEATVIRMIEEGAATEKPASEVEQTVDPAAVAVGVAAGAAIAAAAEEEDAAEDEELLEEGFTLADMRMMANVELAPEDDYIPHMEEVTAEEAESLVENVVAVHHIEHHAPTKASTGKKKRGKPAVLNIDALDEHYDAGETVTLARLKADGLVPKKARALKILASGKLTKPLTVEADRFSLTAVKMILLTGGTPVLLD